MGDFFSYEWIPILLNMSLTASAVILCVLLVRLLLCRAPRVFSYALWAVVLFRLLCPVSLTAGFSLLGLDGRPGRAAAAHATVVEYVPQDVVHAPEPQVVLPVPDGVNDALNTVLPQGEEQTAADPLEPPWPSPPWCGWRGCWPWRGTARSPWSASGGGWQGRSPWRAMSGWRTTSPPPSCWGCSVRGSTSPPPCRRGSGATSCSTSGTISAGWTTS